MNDEIKANKIFNVIRQFSTMFPDEFEKCDIEKCGHCGGNGYDNRFSLEMCTYCGGIGYTGFKSMEGKFVCRSCNSIGCKTCGYTGVVDWIDHARNSDAMTNKRFKK